MGGDLAKWLLQQRPVMAAAKSSLRDSIHVHGRVLGPGVRHVGVCIHGDDGRVQRGLCNCIKVSAASVTCSTGAHRVSQGGQAGSWGCVAPRAAHSCTWRRLECAFTATVLQHRHAHHTLSD